MSLQDEKEIMFKNIPKAIETLEQLSQHGLNQEDIVVVLHARINKSLTKSQRVSKEAVRLTIRGMRKLELDVLGGIR